MAAPQWHFDRFCLDPVNALLWRCGGGDLSGLWAGGAPTGHVLSRVWASVGSPTTRGLGALYSQMRRLEEARAALSTAIDMFRTMGMALWLPQAETTLAQIGERL